MRNITSFRAARKMGLLCSLLASAALVFANPSAGRISALVPAASRNHAAAHLQEELQWNDHLLTDTSGRMRARLLDGSVLSLGAATELTVVQHDAASQQTRLELAYGKLRSMVTPLRRPGSSFRIKTPNAAVGVVGTDFYLDASQDHFLLICFSGTVSVETRGEKYTVKAGQMLELVGGTKGVVRKASTEVTRDALRATSLPGTLDLAPSTRLEASLTSAIDAAKVREGAPVIARVTRDVRVGKVVVVPKGSELVGTVTDVARKGGANKESRLGIAFTSLRTADGQSVAMPSVIDSVVSADLPGDDLEPWGQPSLSGSGGPTTTARQPASGGGGRGLGSTVGAVTNTATAAATPATGNATNGGMVADVPRTVSAGRSLPDVTITPKISDGGSGAVFASDRNVRLAKGTVLVVRTLAP